MSSAMAKKRLPDEWEKLAADRRRSYPENNFAVASVVVVGLIIVIILAYVFGVMR
jgi:hypothetical protein